MGRRTGFITAALAAALAATVVAPAVAQSPAAGDTSQMKIAFSNNYAANSWRQAMLRSWDENAAQEVADQRRGRADVRTTPENDATLQQQQLSDMILEGYNAIVINAANPESLNSVIEEACAQGIPVVSFDGTRDRRLRLPRRGRLRGHGLRTRSSSWPTSCPRAATCSRSAGWPAPPSTSRSARASTRAWRSSRSSRSSAPSMATGPATWPSRRWPASCPACPRTSSAWSTQGGDGYGAAEGLRGCRAAAPDHHHGQPPGRAGLVEGAEGQGRLRDHVAVDRPRNLDGSPSGSPSSCSPAPRTSRTTSSCRTCAGTRTTSRRRSPRCSRVTSAPRRTRRTRSSRSSRTRSPPGRSSRARSAGDRPCDRGSCERPSCDLRGSSSPLGASARVPTHSTAIELVNVRHDH